MPVGIVTPFTTVLEVAVAAGAMYSFRMSRLVLESPLMAVSVEYPAAVGE